MSVCRYICVYKPRSHGSSVFECFFGSAFYIASAQKAEIHIFGLLEVKCGEKDRKQRKRQNFRTFGNKMWKYTKTTTQTHTNILGFLEVKCGNCKNKKTKHVGTIGISTVQRQKSQKSFGFVVFVSLFYGIFHILPPSVPKFCWYFVLFFCFSTFYLLLSTFALSLLWSKSPEHFVLA